MAKIDTKKTWTTPQLIVLARGTPEENVLLHCKAIGAASYTLPSSYQDGCGAEVSGTCAACQDRGGKS